jgi:hypothetical protein
MATRASTNLTNLMFGSPLSLNNGPLFIEYYRCQGGTIGDTTTISLTADQGIKNIVGSFGNIPATSNISTSGVTQVVFTHVAEAASTSVNYDCYIFGYRR